MGFWIPKEGEEYDDDYLALDEFISKIAAIFNSLLEGSQKDSVITQMATTLQFDDIKNRMLNVFGMFLKDLNLFDSLPLKNPEADRHTPLSKLSADSPRGKLLDGISTTKIKNLIAKPGNDLEPLQEAFDIAFILRILQDSGLECAKKHVEPSSFSYD